VARNSFANRLSALWKGRKPELICGFLCLAVAASLGRIVYRGRVYIESENALFQGYFAALSPQISGEIRHVWVEENQTVLKGQLLCVIDDRPFVARLKDAENSRAALEARWEIAKKDARRAERLAREGALSVQGLDHAVALSQDLAKERDAAGARVVEARQNLERTRIRAPAAGILAFRTARPGMYARVGAPLFGLVLGNERWVEAKVKEIDFPDIQVGKAVQVKLDAVPGRSFEGHIQSIGPSTETPFAAVPPDFGAGNFTKYVQWRPIRVAVALEPKDRARVPIGSSSSIEMKRTNEKGLRN
jgi:membrane fusion protein, multidrug efflux system